jgi:hypothetical protein
MDLAWPVDGRRARDDNPDNPLAMCLRADIVKLAFQLKRTCRRGKRLDDGAIREAPSAEDVPKVNSAAPGGR